MFRPTIRGGSTVLSGGKYNISSPVTPNLAHRQKPAEEYSATPDSVDDVRIGARTAEYNDWLSKKEE